MTVPSNDASSCADFMRLMPDCNDCIPGLASEDDSVMGGNNNCTILNQAAQSVRRESMKWTAKLQNKTNSMHRFPYLSVPPLTFRQMDLAAMLLEDRPKRILDVGPYTNPIWKFIAESSDYCPDLIVAAEPSGELASDSGRIAQSVFHPCHDSVHHRTHRIVTPMTFGDYIQTDHAKNASFDAVICLGCHGKTTVGIEVEEFRALQKPFFMYVEYPLDFLPSVRQFNASSIREKVCGSPPTREKDYVFDVEEYPHLKPHAPYSLKRHMASYACIDDVPPGPNVSVAIECDRNEEGCRRMACSSELYNVGRIKDPAFMPVTRDELSMNFRDWNQSLPARRNNCTICEQVLRRYEGPSPGWQTPHLVTTASANTNRIFPLLENDGSAGLSPNLRSGMSSDASFRSFPFIFLAFVTLLRWMIGPFKAFYSVSKRKIGMALFGFTCVVFLASVGNVSVIQQDFRRQTQIAGALGEYRLRNTLAPRSTSLWLDDAEHLLEIAERSFSQGGVHVWNALAAATVARRLLHKETVIGEDNIATQAIADYNKYLNHIVDQTSSEYPSNYSHKLSDCPRHLDTNYSGIAAQKLEEILPHTRNYGFQELGLSNDFFPYRILPSFDAISRRRYRKKILIDVGTDDFFGSPKALVDMFFPYFEFDEVHLFTLTLKDAPTPMEIPVEYLEKFNITLHKVSVAVGTRCKNDMLTFLRDNSLPEDFVAFKFGVEDSKHSGFSMERDFLEDLVHSEEMRLVDDFFIGLHFAYTSLNWNHEAHSALQAKEILPQLRQCGLPVHSWP